MSIVRRSGHLVSSVSIAALSAGLVLGQSGAAQAQVSINGGGATFPVPLFNGVAGDPENPPTGSWFNTYGVANPTRTPGAANPPGPVNPAIQFNYAQGQGSGAGISQFLTQTPRTASPTVSRPFAFGSTESPLSQVDLNRYYTGRADGNAALPPEPPFLPQFARLGSPVQLPIVGGGVANSYTATVGAPNLLDVTRVDLVRLWDGQPVTINGRPVNAAYRSDSSGTTRVFSLHIFAAAGNTGTDWTTPAGVSRGYGAFSLPDNDPGCLKTFVPESDPASTTITPTNPTLRTNTVCWPSTFFRGSGNPGVASVVRANPAAGQVPPNPTDTTTTANVAAAQTFVNGGGIVVGYVEVAVANSFNLFVHEVQNRAGNFIAPTSASITLAFESNVPLNVSNSNTRYVLGFRRSGGGTVGGPGQVPVNPITPNAPGDVVLGIPDPVGAGSYPISGPNYLLLYGRYGSIARGGTIANSLRGFYAWAFGPDGDAIAVDRDYAPLPDSIKTDVLNIVNSAIVGTPGGVPVLQDPAPAGQVFP